MNSRVGLRVRQISWLSKRAIALLREDPSGRRLMLKVRLRARGRKAPLKASNATPALDCITFIDESSSSPAPLEIRSPPQVLVVAHLHYPEFCEKLLDGVRSFPFSSHFLVTTSSQTIADRMDAGLTTLLGDSLRVGWEIRVVPNRGRNIAPLLIEAMSLGRTADLVVHVHSKRSPHAPAESAKAWQERLWSGLLLRPDLVERASALLTRGPDFGLYSPFVGDLLPPYAFSWLSNAGALPDSLRTIPGQSATYFAYPAGGMFMARPEALEPFWRLGLAYSDFPEELGQTDGCLHHALERALGAVATANGFDQLSYLGAGNRFLDAQETVWWSLLQQDAATFQEEILACDFLSVDFFDTLAFRSSLHPDTAKALTAHHLMTTGAISAQDFHNFESLRNRSELELRVESDFLGDVSLREISLRLEDKTGIPASDLERLEFLFDYGLIQPRSPIVRAVNARIALGMPTAIVSDTYYSSLQLRRLALKIGVSGKVDVVSSGSVGRRKDRGDMWAVLPSVTGAPKGSHLHVGDNPMSDGQSPERFGIRSLLILGTQDVAVSVGLPHVAMGSATELIMDRSQHAIFQFRASVGANPFPQPK